MQEKHKKFLSKFGFWTACVFIFLFCTFLLLDLPIKGNQQPGVTFSRLYSLELGLNPDEVLTNILDDLQVRHFRISAYWNIIEKQPNEWSYEWLDRDLDQIASRKGNVTLAIGEKLPRWPECWIPVWVRQLPQQDREKETLEYLEQTVNRYKNHPAIDAWQLENEPGFPFGTCPPVRKEFFDEELTLIRRLDNQHPIATTDSGELSFWKLGKKVDRLGVSVYRVVIGPPFGIFHYWFVPPQFYLRKGQVMSFIWGFKDFYISEFQMEPWTRRPSLSVTPLDEQMETFDIQQMQRNIEFAKYSGISKIDYWGVEWWYWMKKIGYTEFWEMGRQIFN